MYALVANVDERHQIRSLNSRNMSVVTGNLDEDGSAKYSPAFFSDSAVGANTFGAAFQFLYYEQFTGVRIDKVRLDIFTPGEVFGNSKRRTQAKFHFNDSDYDLWATNHHVERRYLARQDGCYNLGESYLTVSLGEPFSEYCYKLVAAIIEKP